MSAYLSLMLLLTFIDAGADLYHNRIKTFAKKAPLRACLEKI